MYKTPMIDYFFKILLLYFLLISASMSKNFDEIIIDGNQRISENSIIMFSGIPEVIDLNENNLNLILKNLFNTGFFNDVNVKIKNKKLIITVVENPIIQTLFIDGIKTNKLRDSLKERLLLKNRSSFNIENVKIDKIEIINVLKEAGYYLPKVNISIEELKDNKINLTYLIDTGNKAKISKISFLGDKKYKDGKLKSIILSEEYKFWKIISKKKYLNENLIDFDTRLLSNFYKNKGYYNAIIESSFANYLGDNKFELIFNIKAGKRFYFNDFELELPDNYDINNFKDLLVTFQNLKGKYYSLNRIDKILDEIDEIVLSKQYEFLSSTVIENIDEDFINFKFNIVESEKLYVEKINIFGNNITREEVIRNNLIVDEGDAFNNLLHNKSINTLKSLNYFKNVRSEIVEGTTDSQKIINISVEEKPTGQISAGAGVGTNGGTVGFAVKENNFMGKGVKLASDITISEETIKGQLQYNQPNYKGTNKSLYFNLESSVADKLKNYGYKSKKTGLSLGTRFEYYDDLFLSTSISSSTESIETDSTASASIIKQKGTFFDTYFNYTLDFDKRNQKFQTSDGYRSIFSQKIPLLSDNYSLKNVYDYKFYNEWSKKNITSLGFYASTVNSINGKDVKLSDRLFVPSSKLRGFESGKIGPTDGTDYIGGNHLLAFNASTSIPQILPDSQNTNFSLFFDAANIWGVDYNSTLGNSSKIRSSVGINVDFFTPIGPLTFSLSESLTKDTHDITESFRFNLGTTF